MTNEFFGLSFGWWTLICLVVALIYYFVWPKPAQGKELHQWQRFVLRWAHSIVWILLALAAFIRYLDAQLTNTSTLLMYLSLFCYVVFLLTVVFVRRS